MVFYQKGAACGAGISADTFKSGKMSFLLSFRWERSTSPPWLSSQPLFFSSFAWLKLDTVLAHYFPRHLSRTWQHVWAKAQQTRLQMREDKEFVSAKVWHRWNLRSAVKDGVTGMRMETIIIGTFVLVRTTVETNGTIKSLWQQCMSWLIMN